jgi:hypothetical protein
MCTTPLFFRSVAEFLRLELEPYSQLNLAFTEEESIRASYLLKGRIEIQSCNWITGGRSDVVNSVIYLCHLSVIEDIETFCQHFQLRSLSYRKAT